MELSFSDKLFSAEWEESGMWRDLLFRSRFERLHQLGVVMISCRDGASECM